MGIVVAAALMLPPLALLAAPLLATFAGGAAGRLPRLITRLVAVQAAVAAAAMIGLWAGLLPSLDTLLAALGSGSIFSITVLWDGISSLMLTLVSCVGWVICRYSLRYLDGDPHQARYFGWTGFTIASVSLMVLAGNLLMLVLALSCTSVGLHHLLLHFGERVAAQRAAWTKFACSRLGDTALLASVVATYQTFGTLRLSEIFSLAGSGEAVSGGMLSTAALCLAAGAVLKSAQFPFHAWLPLTMETPTPVSALMHAGIVNAGGYLIIRTAPLVSLVPTAMNLMLVMGAITACYGALVMLTQTSVKKTLAYSTIAQMGFMILQCGLGAYSAAMLHIVAHSLYKAQAFLGSGSVLQQRTATRGALSEQRLPGLLIVAGSLVAAMTLLALALWLCGIDLRAKPGGWLLGAVMCLGLADWISRVAARRSAIVMLRALTVTAGLCLLYGISFKTVDWAVSRSMPETWLTAYPSSVAGPLVVLVAAGFVLTMGLQLASRSELAAAWQRRWYVHFANGFYIETMLRRLLRIRRPA